MISRCVVSWFLERFTRMMCAICMRVVVTRIPIWLWRRLARTHVDQTWRMMVCLMYLISQYLLTFPLLALCWLFGTLWVEVRRYGNTWQCGIAIQSQKRIDSLCFSMLSRIWPNFCRSSFSIICWMVVDSMYRQGGIVLPNVVVKA